MKWSWPLLLLLFCSCGGGEETYTKADDAIDAGRQYIQACKEGDFKKAAFYMVHDQKNDSTLAEIEKDYRTRDKESRQQLRGASININAIRNLPGNVTRIEYSYSLDKIPRFIAVVKQGEKWLVDIGKE